LRTDHITIPDDSNIKDPEINVSRIRKVVRTKIVPIIITALETVANYYYKQYKSAEQKLKLYVRNM
jgi:hypothetical protein